MRIGLDIGGTKAHAVALTPDGAVAASDRRPTVRGAAGVFATAVASVRALTEALPGRSPESVGVGVPGVVGPSGTIAHAINLEVTALPLADLLTAELGVPVAVENDVKATALGAAEHLAIGDGTLTVLNLGTGISTGTVTGGRLLRGARNAAGEIGHLAVDPGGEPCECGQRGCLETRAGGTRLLARFAALGLRGEDLFPGGVPDGDLPPLPGPALAERARVRDDVALAVRIAAAAYDPDVLVLTGGVVDHAPGLAAAVRERLREDARHSPFLAGLELAERLRVLPAEVPTAVTGAALLPQAGPRFAATP